MRFSSLVVAAAVAMAWAGQADARLSATSGMERRQLHLALNMKDNALNNNDRVKDLGDDNRGLQEEQQQSVQDQVSAKELPDTPPGGGQSVGSQPAPMDQGAVGGAGVAFSPPFYPTPQTSAPDTSAKGSWSAAIGKARALVKRLSTEEKVGLVTGVGWSVGPKPRCVGDIAPIPRVGFPGLCLEDSPLGVRFADLVNVFPSGLSTAATFSKELTYKRGLYMGQDFKSKGVNIALGPGMNLHRVAAGGRNWEMCGADPYHCGDGAFYTTKGLQDAGVQATAKHYYGNEQERLRNVYSSNIDARTEREIYVHPFLRAQQADVSSVMCSYNLVNNSWACQNSDMLNRILKTELGFPGYVMSDWGAQHSGVASALAGLDMTMPGQVACCDPGIKGSFWGANLTQAIGNQSVPVSRLDDMATRILAPWYRLGQDKGYPRPNFDAFDPFYGEHLNTLTAEKSRLIREIGAAGTVLLKNKKNALPLRKPRKVSVVGSPASPYFRGANAFADRGGSEPAWVGWGSGTADYSYLVSPYEAISARARKDSTGVYWNFDEFEGLPQATAISDKRLGVEAALVFVHANSGEEYITVDGNMGDRNNLTLLGNGEQLIRNVSMVNDNTIVIINAPGQIDMESWIENPNITAVIHAHMPGAEAGNAIADVLYGDVNPSGRLPYTIAKKRSDYGADVVYFTSKDTYATAQLPYDDKLEIDYRHFDAKNIEPRYEFGFGLSYSKFKYSNLNVRWLKTDNWNSRKWSWPLPSWLFEDVLEVSFDVRNSDGPDGFEVPQLYLNYPAGAGEPPKVLRASDRVKIGAGQSKTVKWTLNRYDLSTYSAEGEGRWIRPDGRYGVQIGASSRDIRLSKKNI